MANTHSLDLEASSSQYVSIADASQTGLDLSGDFTLELWIKFESLPSSGNLMQFFAKGDQGDPDRSYYFYVVNNAGTYELTVEVDQAADGSNRDNFKWNWSVSTGTWYHLAITCDISNASATTFELFIDTVSQGNGTQVVGNNSSSINDSNDPFVIGALESTTFGSFFDGLINSARVWSDIRTSGEIGGNWKTSTPGGDNLKGSWYYNNDHNDDSGNSNNLTATASPTFSTDIPYDDTIVANKSYAYFM